MIDGSKRIWHTARKKAHQCMCVFGAVPIMQGVDRIRTTDRVIIFVDRRRRLLQKVVNLGRCLIYIIIIYMQNQQKYWTAKTKGEPKRIASRIKGNKKRIDIISMAFDALTSQLLLWSSPLSLVYYHLQNNKEYNHRNMSGRTVRVALKMCLVSFVGAAATFHSRC